MGRSKTIVLSGYDVSEAQILTVIKHIEQKTKINDSVNTNKTDIVITFKNSDTQTINGSDNFKEYVNSLEFEGYQNIKQLNISNRSYYSDPYINVTLDVTYSPAIEITIQSDDRYTPENIAKDIERFLAKNKNFNYVFHEFPWIIIIFILMSLLMSGILITISKLLNISNIDLDLTSVLLITMAYVLLPFFLEPWLSKRYPNLVFVVDNKKRIGHSLRSDGKWFFGVVVLGVAINLFSSYLA